MASKIMLLYCSRGLFHKIGCKLRLGGLCSALRFHVNMLFIAFIPQPNRSRFRALGNSMDSWNIEVQNFTDDSVRNAIGGMPSESHF
jgi:hypothetical protein